MQRISYFVHYITNALKWLQKFQYIIFGGLVGTTYFVCLDVFFEYRVVISRRQMYFYCDHNLITIVSLRCDYYFFECFQYMIYIISEYMP